MPPDRPAALERIVSRDRLIVGFCLAAAAALSWLWLVGRAGGSGAMTAAAMAPAVWSADYLAATFLMWLLMMVAMMLPSAAPVILLYARFARRAGAGGAAAAAVLFAATYLAVWAAFSALATALQAALVASGAVSAMELAVGDRRLAAGLLVFAGLYQISPVKRACLAACRSPVDFLMRLWRPGTAGALRLGAAHGLHCLGCCWALMLLLFVGGAMNLAWIAGLALLVLAERLAPPGFSRALAAALLLGGLYLLATA